jgi:hypothetical protein
MNVKKIKILNIKFLSYLKNSYPSAGIVEVSRLIGLIVFNDFLST